MRRVKENREEKALNIKSYKTKVMHYIKNIMVVSISAQIMLLPIIAYNYKTISFTFFITNVLTSFLIGIIIIFGFILILISFISLEFAKTLGNIYKLFLSLLLLITENTAKIPFSKVYIKSPYMLEIIIYYISIFVLLHLYNKFRKKIIQRKIKKKL